jgi:4-carboxymuconolactone decarboxylase
VSAARQDRTGLAASTAAGWARLRDQLEADAAMAARDKALILAAVAAVRGRDELLRRESARLAELGGAGMVAGCASVLTVARGREVADHFAGATGLSLDWEVDVPRAATESDLGAALEYFAPPPAEAPPAISLLAEHAPGVLVGYRDLRAGIYDEGSLEPQLVELLLFAISAADYQPGHAAVHARKAVEQGAAEPQLVEAGLCAIAAAGMASWLIAATVIAELEPTKEVPA